MTAPVAVSTQVQPGSSWIERHQRLRPPAPPRHLVAGPEGTRLLQDTGQRQKSGAGTEAAIGDLRVETRQERRDGQLECLLRGAKVGQGRRFCQIPAAAEQPAQREATRREIGPAVGICGPRAELLQESVGVAL